MIMRFVERFNAGRGQLLKRFRAAHPESYLDIVRAVIETITDADLYGEPDPERIHEIDDGDYQGTLLFVIGATGYQPSTYWSVDVGYGSCSGCDTLEAIRDYSGEPPTEEQAKEYLVLALHIVQKLKSICGYGNDEPADNIAESRLP